MNLRFGVQMRHYAISLFSECCVCRLLRQILLHICPGSPALVIPVLGLAFTLGLYWPCLLRAYNRFLLFLYKLTKKTALFP